MSALIYTYNDTPDKRVLMCLMFLTVAIITGVQDQECVNDLNEPYGIIMSENYPKPIRFQPCTWNIKVAKGKTITLIFRDLDLDIKEEDVCVQNFLEVSLGDTPSSLKFCGNEIPTDVKSATDNITITFNATDLAYNKRGFFIEYAASDVKVSSMPMIAVQPDQSSVEWVIQCGALSENPAQKTKSYSLYRYVASNISTDYVLIAEAKAELSDSAQMKENLSGVEVQGSIHTTMKLTFKEATCKDSGIYKCESRYTDGSKEETAGNYTNVYISSNPKRSIVTITPVKQCYEYDSEVTLQCFVSIGSVHKGIHKELEWQSKRANSDWDSQTLGEITMSAPVLDSEDACNWIQESTLKLKVDHRHSGLEFRCIIQEYGILRNAYDLKQYINSSIAFVKETRNIKEPTKVQISVKPDLTSYIINTEIAFTCQCSIGISTDVIRTVWKWEYKDIRSKVWTEYPASSNIKTIDPPKSDNECDRLQISKLLITLSLADNNREYRCLIVRTNKDGQEYVYTPLAGTYHIREVLGTNHQKPDILVIIGVTLGACLLIITLMVVTCYSWHLGRLRQIKGDKRPRPSSRKTPAIEGAFQEDEFADSSHERSSLDAKRRKSSSDLTKVSSSVDWPPRRKGSSVDLTKVGSSVDWPPRRPSSSVDL